MAKIFTFTGSIPICNLPHNKLSDDGLEFLCVGFILMFCRGEKAFCSVECRLKEISFDEATEETTKGSGEEGGILGQAP